MRIVRFNCMHVNYNHFTTDSHSDFECISMLFSRWFFALDRKIEDFYYI